MKVFLILLLFPAIFIDGMFFFIAISMYMFHFFIPGNGEAIAGGKKFCTFMLTRAICRKLGWIAPAKPKKQEAQS